MQLADLMATDVLAVSPDATIADAARRMIARETGAAVVLEDGRLNVSMGCEACRS